MHRVQIPDLFSHAATLIERLKEKYPHLRNEILHGWLRGKIMSNEALFITNGEGVLLAEMVREDLSPIPTVVERFVLRTRPDSSIEKAAELYGDLMRWAEGLGAKEIVVEQLTDIPREMIKKQFGAKLVARETIVCKMEKVPMAERISKMGDKKGAA